MERVAKNAPDVHIQVYDLLLRSEVPANWIAIRMVALDYPYQAAPGVVGVHSAICIIIADCYLDVAH